MRIPELRFTIAQMLVAVAAIGCFLALSRALGGMFAIWTVVTVVTALVFCASLWGEQRRASRVFEIAALAVNCSLPALSIYAPSQVELFGVILALFLGCPLTLGAGSAWAAAATRREAVRRRSPLVAWLLVIVLTTLPFTMVLTRWPLHVAFFVSRPALDRLADQAAAGQAQSGPVLAGLFLVIGTAVDPTTGNVRLITGSDHTDQSGLVRVKTIPASASGPVHGPFYNLSSELLLGGGWWYQSED